jgi:hypothetical protein
MKTRFYFTLLLLATVLLGGCQDELKARIDALKDDVTYIEQEVASLNENLSSLSSLVSALEKNDHITRIVPYSVGNRSGYQIVFASGSSLILRIGSTGVSPILGVMYNDNNEGYYWTIQMGETGSPTWMTNSYGLPVRATGTVPELKIEDGIWWYSFDGSSWIKCNWGAAQGSSGSSVFSRIDTSDPYYVVFTLANGTSMQLPTQLAFDELNEQCTTLNEAMQTYTDILQQTDSSIFVQSVAEFEEGAASGWRITFETGKQVTIRNGYDNRDSVLLSAKKYKDGKMYWVYRSRSSESYQWLRYQGKMVCVTMEDITPHIGITESMGQLYFTVAVGDGPAEMMLDPDGNPVPATGHIVEDFFSAADVSDISKVVLTLSDGTKVVLPRIREYIPSFTTSLRDYVEAGKHYTFQLLVFMTDTLLTANPLTDYQSYCDSSDVRFEAVCLDDGYAEPVVCIEITSKPVAGGYAYSIILDVPFTTGPASGWDTSRPSRIALFLSWQNKTIMKVCDFRRAVLPTAINLPATAGVTVGGSITLVPTISPSNATSPEKNVTWETEDASIATVDAHGVVTGVAAGSCKITAKTTRPLLTAECVVTVTAP